MTANKSNLRAHSTPLMKNSAGVISARQKANKEVLFCKDWCVQELFWNLDVLFVRPLYRFFFHVPFWLIVRLENVSFDDYLLALEIESSFQRRRLLECKILDSLSLETEEVGVCRWCLATLVTSSEIFDFFLVCWLQKSIKALWISEKSCYHCAIRTPLCDWQIVGQFCQFWGFAFFQ